MSSILNKIKNNLKAPEKAAIATSITLLTLDLMGGAGLFSSLGLALEGSLGGKICKGVGGALGGYFPSLFQRMQTNADAKKNHTNAILFIDATKECLGELKAWFAEESQLFDIPLFSRAYPDDKDRRRFFKDNFIEPFFSYFETEDKIEKIFNDNAQLDPGRFIEFAFDNALDFTQGELKPFMGKKDKIKEQFCKVFRESFLDRIRIKVSANPVLKDSYHTFLLHQIITAFDLVKEQLGKMSDEMEVQSEMLRAITILQQELNHTVQIQHRELETLIEKHIRKQNEFNRDAYAFFRKQSLPSLLYNAKQERKDRNDLAYTYRNTRYVGREDIKTDMITFMEEDKPFSWAMISGVAGQGKSRLALELCDLYRHLGWYTGFCSDIKGDYEWDKFDSQYAGKGLLMVIDYVSGREKLTKELLKKLALRMDNEQNGKVRVLLLEREFSKEWIDGVPYLDHVKEHLYKNVQNGKSSSLSEYDNIERFSTNKNEKPEELYFKLPQLNDNDLLNLIAEVANQEFTGEEKTIIIGRLEKTDKEKRPLIAFVFGLYIKDKGITDDFKNWADIAAPLNYILYKEEERWEKAEWLGQRKYKVFAKWSLLITALIQEADASSLIEAIAKVATVRYAKAIQNIDGADIEELYTLLSSFRNSKCCGLQPDLLAEYYIVRYLENVENKKDFEEVTILLDSALALMPENTIAMLVKTEQDFATHKGFEYIKQWIEKKIAEADTLELPQAKHLAEICFGMLENNAQEIPHFYYEKVRYYFHHLEQIQQAHNADRDIALFLARGAMGLGYYYIANTPPNIDNATDIFEQHILPLQKYFAEDKDIALQQAKSAYNLIWYYTNQEPYNIEEATDIFEQHILPLQKHFAEDKDIALQQAKSAYNLIWYYIREETGNIQEATAVFCQHILPLQEHFAEDKDIALRQAISAYNLIWYYTNQEPYNIEEAIRISEKGILALRNENILKDNIDIALELAISAANLSWYYIDKNTSEDNAKARSIYNEYILPLREDIFFKDNVDIKAIAEAVISHIPN